MLMRTGAVSPASSSGFRASHRASRRLIDRRRLIVDAVETRLAALRQRVPKAICSSSDQHYSSVRARLLCSGCKA